MRLIELKCQNCGSKMSVDAEQKEVTCDFCGTKFAIDDEIQHIQYDNAEQAGYEFEKGRQKAQAEQHGTYSNSTFRTTPAQPKKRRTWLWVIGWVLMFPLPLTILMVRNKKLNKWVRIAIIAVAWIVYFAICLSGSKSDTNSTTASGDEVVSAVVSKPQQEETTKESKTTTTTKTQPTSATTIAGESALIVPSTTQHQESTDNSPIDSLVQLFNNNSNQKLTFVEEFSPQDKSNGHYRTEFRLTSYKDAVGKSYKYDGITIDLIESDRLSKPEPAVRLYADDVSLEQCNEIIKASAIFFDPEFTESDIKEITDFINEHGEANGYYNGGLGISYIGSDLMLKYSND